MNNYKTMAAKDFIEFNPKESIKKGAIATKIAMDKLMPFQKYISSTERASFSGGSKFKNGDTLFARITPCLENGKTAFVDGLSEGEVAFGSTEFIVLRSREGISDPQYVYYLATSSSFRNIAIKSMVGSSGRQRVQLSVLEDMVLKVPSLKEQRIISSRLAMLDKKIYINAKINDNLMQQAEAIYRYLFIKNASPKWRTGSLDELVVVRYGKDHQKLADGSIPVYGSGGVMRFAERALYEHESVLIPRLGSLHNVIYVNHPFWSVNTMFYTEMKLCNVAKYVYFYLKSLNLVALNAGSAVPRITTEILKSLQIKIPSDSTLLMFESMVAPLFKTITHNNFENKKLQDIRDCLLIKFFS